MNRGVRSFLLALLALLTTSCAQIPNRELSQYRNAFSEVQQASEEILIDFAEAKAEAERRTAAQAPSTLAVPFSTELQYAESKAPDAVEVRRSALRTIDKFNNVLVTLAEGKSVEAVQGAAGGFVQAAGNFIAAVGSNAVPGLSAVTGLTRTLAAQLEKARLREEFEAALREGAPIIDQMLAALIEERSDHIALRADEATLRQVEIIDDVTVLTASVHNMIKARGAPPTDDPKEEIQTALNEALAPVQQGLQFRLPLVLEYTAGRPALSASELSVAQETISQIRERAASYRANVAQYESLRSALNNYGAMLDKTRATLETLVDALDEPQEFEDASEELFKIAFSVKRDIEEFRAARKAAH